MATPEDPEDTPMPDADDVEGEADTDAAGERAEDDQEDLDDDLYVAMESMIVTLIEAKMLVDGNPDHQPSKIFMKRPSKTTPQYYDVIDEPMAFSVIKEKLRRHQYTSVTEFVRDCGLIWRNAVTYNLSTAPAFHDAELMKELMEVELSRLVTAGAISELDAQWPEELGGIPSENDVEQGQDAEAENQDEDDAEGGSEDDEDGDDGADKKRSTRPNDAKRGESGDASASKRRGRPPKVDTPLEARIKNVLKGLRKLKEDDRTLLIAHFEKFPDKASNPAPGSTPAIVTLEQIRRSQKRKRYKTVDDCVKDLDELFNTAIENNKGVKGNTKIVSAATLLKKEAHRLADEEKKKRDEEFSFDEGRKPKPGGIEHKGEIWKVGDWIHIKNPNDANKPIVAQIYRTWEDDDGAYWINACWYYRPEQTVHHFEKHFWPDEVLKTSQYRDHRIDEVEDKCFVMFFTRYTRGRPKGLPSDRKVYVCEARYNEEKHKINKIKTWSSCLPDEVRDRDYAMELFPQQMRIKKLPTPLEHMVERAPENSSSLKPKMGTEDAPPIEGAVYKGPREENQSPPPSPTPSPAPTPARTTREASQTPARDAMVSKASRPNDVDNAMASATRAFGAGNNTPAQAQGTFIQQRHGQASASPAPQYGQSQPARSNSDFSAPQSNHVRPGDQFATPTTSRFAPPQRSISLTPAANNLPTNIGFEDGPMLVPPEVNAAFSPEERERWQRTDDGVLIAWPRPPVLAASPSPAPDDENANYGLGPMIPISQCDFEEPRLEDYESILERARARVAAIEQEKRDREALVAAKAHAEAEERKAREMQFMLAMDRQQRQLIGDYASANGFVPYGDDLSEPLDDIPIDAGLQDWIYAQTWEPDTLERTRERVLSHRPKPATNDSHTNNAMPVDELPRPTETPIAKELLANARTPSKIERMRARILAKDGQEPEAKRQRLGVTHSASGAHDAYTSPSFPHSNFFASDNPLINQDAAFSSQPHPAAFRAHFGMGYSGWARQYVALSEGYWRAVGGEEGVKALWQTAHEADARMAAEAAEGERERLRLEQAHHANLEEQRDLYKESAFYLDDVHPAYFGLAYRGSDPRPEGTDTTSWVPPDERNGAGGSEKRNGQRMA